MVHLMASQARHSNQNFHKRDRSNENHWHDPGENDLHTSV
jgi:hypothetical protein